MSAYPPDSGLMVAAKVGTIIGCAALSAGAAYLITDNIGLNPDEQMTLTTDKSTLGPGDTGHLSLVSAKPAVRAWVSVRIDGGDWTVNFTNGSISVPGSFDLPPPIDVFAEHDYEVVCWTPQKITQSDPTPGPYWVSNILTVHYDKAAGVSGKFTLSIVRTDGKELGVLPHQLENANDTLAVLVKATDKSGKDLNYDLYSAANTDEPLVFAVDSEGADNHKSIITCETERSCTYLPHGFGRCLPAGKSTLHAFIYSKDANQTFVSSPVTVEYADDFYCTLATSFTSVQTGNKTGVSGTVTVTNKDPEITTGYWFLVGLNGALTDVNGNRVGGLLGQTLTILDTQIGYSLQPGNHYIWAAVWKADNNATRITNALVIKAT